MKRHVVSIVFLTSAAYNGLLGLMFLVFGPAVFRFCGGQPPGHPGCVQFPALLSLIFAYMLLQIARRPAEKRVLIPYAVVVKLCFSAVVLENWALGDIDYLWKPLALYDLVFAAMFYWGYESLARRVT